MEIDLNDFLTPQQAWKELKDYTDIYYKKYSAMYSGDKRQIIMTAEPGTFWARNGKSRVHVPIAADIAATSSDLLFSEEPIIKGFDSDTEFDGSEPNDRLDFLMQKNNLFAKLNEGAESASILGDVFLKISWNKENAEFPTFDVVQADSAWPEYRFGVLQCVHFFSIYKKSVGDSAVWRMYERYTKGRIQMAIFKGSSELLGSKVDDDVLRELGFEPDFAAPVDELLAAHIVNIKPNRIDRSSVHGRADCEGLRDLMDALDETYSSWVRDIRLAKARLIVPAEYLRRKPQEMLDTNAIKYEFDEDIETLVALDIDSENTRGNPITPSQFQIRSNEHYKTCAEILRNIVTIAGYAPQTFGIEIVGNAQSGTALSIRERKSLKTKGKKQAYWKSPLESILTSLVHLDAVLYPEKGSRLTYSVTVQYVDDGAGDISTLSQAVEMLNRAAAVSTETKVQMLHPDWNDRQIEEEISRVKQEFGLAVPEPDEFSALPEMDTSEADTEEEAEKQQKAKKAVEDELEDLAEVNADIEGENA